jgi:hypothetical protein
MLWKARVPHSLSLPVRKFSCALATCEKEPVADCPLSVPVRVPASLTLVHVAVALRYDATTLTEPSVEEITIGAPQGFMMGASIKSTSWLVVVVVPMVSVAVTLASKKAGIAVVSVVGQLPVASGESYPGKQIEGIMPTTGPEAVRLTDCPSSPVPLSDIRKEPDAERPLTLADIK